MRASPFALAATAVVGALLAGCASEPTTVAAAPTAAAPAKAATKPETLTGSRIARPGTDRIVRAVDNQTFRDDTNIRSIGNEVGMRGN